MATRTNSSRRNTYSRNMPGGRDSNKTTIGTVWNAYGPDSDNRRTSKPSSRSTTIRKRGK